VNPYLGLKYAHILIAIIALGTGAAVGILVGFFGDDAAHGAFLLRLSRKLLHWVVLPGYALMLATGMWMGHLADLLDARWTEAAMNLWGVGALFYALFAIFLRRRITLWETEGPASPGYRRAAWLSSGAGAGAGIVILIILGFMTFKPA
jgi:predicted integral membrane protein DUF2269